VTDQLSAAYWGERYRNNEMGWDIGEISTPLKTYFDGLENKQMSILIPGAGNAYEAEYLVNKGFGNVFVCDLAIEPLQNLKARCDLFNSANLIHGNFFELDASKFQFNLIIEQTFFCALNPSLRTAYFQKMHQLLKSGGALAGLLFDDKLNDDRPPFGGSSKEYPAYFKNLFKIKKYEKCYNSIEPRQGREIFMNLQKI
jgi:thiopurine S-methyltransferase